MPIILPQRNYQTPKLPPTKLSGNPQYFLPCLWPLVGVIHFQFCFVNPDATAFVVQWRPAVAIVFVHRRRSPRSKVSHSCRKIARARGQ
jgi:hypothetical protein